MSTLSIPSFDRRLLRTIKEEAEAQPIRTWPEPSLQTALHFVQELRIKIRDVQQALTDHLSECVEAEAFAKVARAPLHDVDETLEMVRDLIARFSSEEDILPSPSLLPESRKLEEDLLAFRDLLTDALAKATAPPGTVDWDRIRASKAAYASGQTKPFSRR